MIAAETELCMRSPPDTLLDEVLRDGVLVRISGVNSKPGLNGQLALVQARVADSGRWACKLLQDERMISFKFDNLVVVKGMLPILVLKKALCLRGISHGLHGGWVGLTSAQFLRGMQLLADIHIEKPHGRTAGVALCNRMQFGPDEGKHMQLDRMLFAHFDLVFEDGLIPVVESFVTDSLDDIGVAHSRPVEIDIDGERADLVFKIESAPNSDNSHDRHVCLNVYLDLEKFKLKAKGLSLDDTLIISIAVLSTSHEHVLASHTLTQFDSTGYVQALRPWHGLYRPDHFEPLFSWDPTMNEQHHVSTLVLYAGSAAEGKTPVWAESTRRIKRGKMEGSPVIRTAIWNRDLHSTDVLPIISPKQNDQALEPFPEGTFDGAIALLRRRGGNGFAQKASVAKAAGAVGCIIFDGDGPLDPWFFEPGCSLVFNDVTYPNPGIPTLLVDRELGMKLSAAARSCDGARAQILVDSSRETLMKLSPELEEFISKAVAGEPFHLAVLVERKAF